MKIWVDLANSPQVLFFRPILNELRRRGHEVWVTTRDYAQTIQLAEKFGIPHTPIGRHGGEGLYGLASELSRRAVALVRWARPRRFDLAVSHNSYAQALATVVLGLPLVTLMDYEHQPLNHLSFRVARRVIVPEAFPAPFLRRFGASKKTLRYPGIKEHVYLSGFVPSQDFRGREGLPEDRVLAAVRPPATWTLYHRFENDLFDLVLDHLLAHPEAHVLFLPRLRSQADAVATIHRPNFQVQPRPYDGPDLLYHADLVVSAGGTMNREAAVLGTPAYSVFRGRMTAVDTYLVERGRLVRIINREEIPGIKVERRNGRPGTLTNPRLLQTVTDSILGGVES